MNTADTHTAKTSDLLETITTARIIIDVELVMFPSIVELCSKEASIVVVQFDFLEVEVFAAILIPRP